MFANLSGYFRRTSAATLLTVSVLTLPNLLFRLPRCREGCSVEESTIKGWPQAILGLVALDKSYLESFSSDQLVYRAFLNFRGLFGRKQPERTDLYLNLTGTKYVDSANGYR